MSTTATFAEYSAVGFDRANRTAPYPPQDAVVYIASFDFTT